MSHREQTDKITPIAVRQLTKCLSLAPLPGQTQPSEEWLAQQKEQVRALPRSCCRPAANDPVLAIVRGVIKASEMFSDVPFVPDAAVLCKAHKDLHPWRIRSLFLLLASEVGIKSDRIRRHRGANDLPPSDAVLAFIRRMTSVAGMWIEPVDFENRFGFRAEGFGVMESGCEACMLAAVGARAEVLVDLRANILARQKIGDNYKPALLRFVDSWIHHFAAHSGYLMIESDKLEHQLRSVREVEHERRRRRNERHRQRTGRDQKLPRRVLELNSDGIPVPRALKRAPSHGASHSGSRPGKQPEPHRPVTWNPQTNPPAPPIPPSDAAAPGGRDDFEEIGGWRQEVARPSLDEAAAIDTPNVDVDVDAQLDGREEGDGEWIDEVGSYYFPSNASRRDKGKDKDASNLGIEKDDGAGARSNWKSRRSSVTSSARIHPAFRRQGPSSVSGDRGRHGSGTPEKTLTGAEKLHALLRGGSSASQRRPSSLWGPTTSGPSNRSTPEATGSGSVSSSSRGAHERRRSRGYGESQLSRSGSTASLLRSMSRGPAADDESASLWTEGTLHTAGGRTDLGLAAPSPDNDFLANLVRDERGVRVSSSSSGGRPPGYPRQVDEATLSILEGRIPPPDPRRRPSGGGWLGRPSSWSSSVYSANEEPPEPPRPLPAQGWRQSRSTENTDLGFFMRHHDGGR